MEEPNKACQIRFFCATFLSGIDQGPLGTGSSDLFDIFLWLGLTAAEDIGASVPCLEEGAPSQGLKTKMCVASHIDTLMESLYSRRNIIKKVHCPSHLNGKTSPLPYMIYKLSSV